MHPFVFGWLAARRRGDATRGPTRRPGTSTARLVLLELGWLAGRVLRPSRLLPAVAAGIIVALLLSPITPGPVLSGGWRTAVAVGGAVLGAMTAHVLLQRAAGAEQSRTTVALVGVAAVALLGSVSTIVAHVLGAVAGGPVRATGTVGAGLAVDGAVAAGAALLLAGMLVARLSDRLRVPGAIALLGLGMLLGSDGLGLVEVDDPQWVQGLAVVALIVILYHGGLTTRPRELRGAVAPGVVLASVGVAVTATVVALTAIHVLGMPARLAWLLAVVVAPTDAAAVLAVLRRTPLRPRLAGMLQVESGANDPIAVLLTLAVLTAEDAGAGVAAWFGFGVAQVGLGAALGVGVGLVASRDLARLAGNPLVAPLALAVGGVAYGVTAVVGGSGFLAVYLCGVTVAARAPSVRGVLRAFHGALASSVEVGLFLLLGLLMFPAELPAVLGTGVAVTVVLALVARPLAVALSLAPFGARPADVVAVSWLGLRGAVPIVLATVAFSAGSGDAPVLLDIVFVVVLASTLLQATTAGALVRRLGVAAPASPAATLVAASPFEGLDGEVVEVTVGERSRLVGATLASVPPPAGMLVTAIVRGAVLVVPRGGTVLMVGDLLMLASDRSESVGAVRSWAADRAAAGGPAARPG